jgi:ABC-type Mn2+/Zn2+ transport system permease subunit
MSWLVDTFSSSLMQRALIEVLLVGALAGVVGVHVVLRHLSFFTMSLTHATFPGLVLAELLGIGLLTGTAAFGLLVVVGIALLTRVRALDAAAATGVVLAAGFALGVALLSSQPGFSRDLTAFLVGSVLTVQVSDLVVTAIAGTVVLAVVIALHKELVMGAFDREGLVALGYPALVLDVVLLVAVELTVVSAIPAVGTILAVALIVAPAATARLWTDRIGASMALAGSLGAVSGAVGLALSSRWDVAAGPTIVVVLSTVFVASSVLSPRHGLLARGRGSTADPPADRAGTPSGGEVAAPAGSPVPRGFAAGPRRPRSSGAALGPEL